MIERFRQALIRILGKIPTRQINLNNRSDTETVIREWRLAILNAFLTIVLVASMPAFVSSLVFSVKKGLYDLPMVILCVAEISLVLAAVVRKLSYRVRVDGLLLAGYLAWLFSLLSIGTKGSGQLYFLILPVIALILLGKRASILVSVIGVSLLFTFDVFIQQGVYVPRSEGLGGASPSVWMVFVATVMILTTLMALLILFYRLQEQIVHNDRVIYAELMDAQLLLEKQNASLEQKVKQRTDELLHSNNLLSALYKIADAASGSHDRQEFFARIHAIIGELMYARNLYIALYDETTGLLSFPYFVDEKDERSATQPLKEFHGVTGYVIRTGNSIKHGWDEYNRLVADGEVELVGSYNEDGIGAPLKVEDKVIGAIFVQAYIPGIYYTDQDDEVLAYVAKHIAIALMRFQALEAERRKTTELAIINSIQSAMAFEQEFQDIIDMVGDKLGEALAAPRIAITLYHSQTNSLQYLYAAERGERLNLPTQPPPVGSIIEKVIRIHANGFLEYGEKVDNSVSNLPKPGMCKSGIIVPIFNNEILGAIQVEDDEREYVYGESDVHLLATVAASLGTVLENTRLANQRNEAIEALRQSEEKFRTIVQALPQTISIWDLDFNCRYVSPSVYNLTGYTPAERLTLRDEEFLVPASTTLINQALRNEIALEQTPDRDPNRVITFDVEEIRKDGSRIILQCNYTFLRDAAGRPESILVIASDITERKRAEMELRESNEKLRLIFENAFDGISIYEEFPDQDRRILLDCNDRYCQMAGRSKEELLAIQDTRSIQVDLGNDTERFNWESIVSGNNFLRVFSWVRRDGTENIIENNAAPTKVGGRYFTIGLDRDITERKQSEQALRESEQRLMDIIDFLPIATLVTDRDGRVTAWNRAIEDMTGVKGDDLIGKGNYEYALPFYGKRMPILIDLVSVPEEEMDARYQYIRRFGGILSAESFTENLGDNGRMLIGFASALYGSDGQICGAIESIEDVTELRQAEKELKEAKEAAESANRSKSAFLANMSHEIRTPMNAVLGFTQLMQHDPDLTTRQREQLAVISRSGEHLLALINDILELSKIEAGASTFLPANFDLHKLLADMEMMFKVRTDEKKLHLLLEYTGIVPHWVITDEGKLRQVLINLIGNAVKFTQEGGIGIRVDVQASQTNHSHLVFEVEDTGPGISNEEMNKLFQPFEQASTGLKMGGTGLGLALSQGFVQIMGGNIAVSSTVGVGSIFRFSIPFEPGHEEETKWKLPPNKVVGLKAGQGELRILVADDRETNRQILAEMLAPVGFSVLEATNGAEAIDLFKSWQPQIILMDMRMPVMDGYEATRKIKDELGGNGTVIIAVTASAFQEDRQKVLAAGADGYITKPFKEMDLFEIIRQLAGIVYQYEDEVFELQPTPEEYLSIQQEAIKNLPENLKKECCEAAENADIFRLLALIDDICMLNAQIGQVLCNLANRYAYEEIANLLSNGA